MSIYQLKPRFQNLLRPAVASLHRLGVTANAVTLLAALISVALGVFLTWNVASEVFFWFLPLWMLTRMAFNAVDGMLAREFGQKSHLGAFLNELTDVISDSALYLPFAFLPHFHPLAVGTFIVLAVITEMTGTVAVMVGASRRYDGPLGKSDRAFAIGLLGIMIALGTPPAPWMWWIFPLLTVLACWTIGRRVRRGLEEIR